VGGIYGVAVGRMFFGESMFSAESGGSKAALAGLATWLQRQGWPLIDAQVENAHLLSLGAERWPRRRFLMEVERLAGAPEAPRSWRDEFGSMPATTLAPPAPSTNRMRFFASIVPAWHNDPLFSWSASAARQPTQDAWRKTTS